MYLHQRHVTFYNISFGSSAGYVFIAITLSLYHVLDNQNKTMLCIMKRAHSSEINTYMYFSFWEKQIINRKENTERYNLIGIMLFLDIGQMLWHHHWRQLEKFGCFDFREVRTDWCTGKAGIPNTWVGILNAVPSTDMM